MNYKIDMSILHKYKYIIGEIYFEINRNVKKRDFESLRSLFKDTLMQSMRKVGP